MNARLAVVLCALLLTGCNMKQECDQQRDQYRAARNAPAPERPMVPRDLPAADRDEIEIACMMKGNIGDIQGKNKCRQELEKQAVAGRMVMIWPPPSTPLPSIDGRCDLPWNK